MIGCALEHPGGRIKLNVFHGGLVEPSVLPFAEDSPTAQLALMRWGNASKTSAFLFFRPPSAKACGNVRFGRRADASAHSEDSTVAARNAGGTLLRL